jgi:hypothetical protein
MILVHGTSTANTEAIRAEGAIVPRRDRGNWYKEYQQPSIRDFVYFADKKLHAEFHAARTATVTQSDCAVLYVNIDPEHLYPDENFFNTKGIVNVEDIAKMQKKAIKFKTRWKDSLEKINLVCHKGAVAADAIVDEDRFPISESIYYGFVKHFDNPSVEDFDVAFNMFLRAHRMWDDPFEEKVKNFEVVPKYSESGCIEKYHVWYKDQCYPVKYT